MRAKNDYSTRAGAVEADAGFHAVRPFIYYWERSLEHSIPSDAGAQLRDGMKVVSKRGARPESEWPYDDTPADEETQLFPHSSGPMTAAEMRRAAFNVSEVIEAC